MNLNYCQQSNKTFKSKMLTKASFLFVLLMTITFYRGYANAQSVTLHLKQSSINHFFDELSKQTGYKFLYKDIKRWKSVTVDVSNQPLREVLDIVLNKENLSYKAIANTFVITETIADKSSTNLVDSVIKGKVQNAQSDAMANVNVFNKRNKETVKTDNNGNFAIHAKKGDIITFNYIGYTSQNVKISDASNINITLSETSSDLDEVVVIGYGSVNKKNVTGSIASVKGSDLDVATASNFSQALQGKAPGVQVIQSTGQPGANVSVQLRTNPSFASAGVLYVIDGVPVNSNANTPNAAGINQGGTDQNPLNFINPNDIESIEFLKDAASGAIYGARAGAGVVLITTKRGKNNEAKVQYSTSYAVQNASKMFSTLETKEYMQRVNLAIQENWLRKNTIAPFGNTDPTTITPIAPRYTNEQIANATQYQTGSDGIIRKGYTQQHDISISGGNDKTKYFISGNYYDQKGIVIGTDFKRWNGRVNLDQKISEKIKVGTNIVASNTLSNVNGTGGRYEASGILTAAFYYPSTFPLVKDDGTYPLNPLYSSAPNPLSYTTVTNKVSNARLLTSGYATWEIIKDLTAKANLSYDQSTAKREMYLPTTFAPGAALNGLASLGNNTANTKLMEYTLSYDKTIGKNQKLNAVIGYSYNNTVYNGLNGQNQNFVSDAFSYYNLASGTTPVVGSSKSENTWASYYGRVMYAIDNKYTLQASLRRDGFDKFAKNKKWGYFPSVSGAWVVSEENFLKPIKAINYLKLRLSYGEVGNSNIGQSALSAYGLVSSPVFGANSTVNNGIALTQASNDNLTWETNAELNFGLDFGIFKDRITGSVDYYIRNIRNLLTNVPFPQDFTVPSVVSNAGTTRAQGYDIGVQTKNIVNSRPGGFTWSSNFTFSHYLAYWTKRSPQALANLEAFRDATGKNALFNGVYGYISEGLYKGGATPAQMPNLLPGNLIIRDIHGYNEQGNLTGSDGLISVADQTLLGNADPKFSIGIGNSFTFNNFDLNIFFSGMVKHAWSPYSPNAPSSFNISTSQANLVSFGWNTSPWISQQWSSYNTSSSVPAGFADPRYVNYQNRADYWWIDASYLRCRNITLGYRLPASALANTKVVSGIRLYVDVQNAFTITKYPELDPEINQGNFYPLTRSVVFGLNASF